MFSAAYGMIFAACGMISATYSVISATYGMISAIYGMISVTCAISVIVAVDFSEVNSAYIPRPVDIGS